MSFKIKIKRKAQKSLSKIPAPFQSKIIDSIRELSNNPFPSQSKKLTGRDGWRIRIGNYRAIYEVLIMNLLFSY